MPSSGSTEPRNARRGLRRRVQVLLEGDLLGQDRLAGAGFAFDQQGALQGDGGIHCQFQILCGDVSFATFKTHFCISL